MIPYAEVIGDPIAHSKSPLIHRFWLQKLGLEADYRAVQVRPEALHDYLDSRRGDPAWRGCNVSAPCKQAVLPHLDDIEPSAERIGAVNAIVTRCGRLRGTNTDVVGITAALDVPESPGNQVCVIGTGGAAKALLHVLRERDTMEVSIVARDIERARRLQRESVRSGGLYCVDDSVRVLAGADWVINATPLGMVGQPSMPEAVLDGLSGMEEHGLVFDMVYAPVETALLRRATELGRRTVDGLTMLIGQAAPAFELFFGQSAPREHDGELRRLLTS
jgi:shikimate dehydrogenase